MRWTSKSSYMACAVILGVTTPAMAGGSCTEEWHTEIGLSGVVGGWIEEFVTYDDGSGAGPQLYAAGTFESAGGVPGTVCLAKWNGTSWESVGGGLQTPGQFDGGFSMAVFQNELYVGGSFASAGGVPGTAMLAKWNGRNWSGVNAQLEGQTGGVTELAVHDDGSGPALYVAGNFLNMNGQADLYFLARWNGKTWSGANGIPGGLGLPQLYAMEEFGGDLYIGGHFQAAGGVPVTNIARFDGKQWHDVGGGVSGAVARIHDLEVFDDGSGPALYAAGSFTWAGGDSGFWVHGIAKWDGTSWSAVGVGVFSPAFATTVHALTVYDNGSGNALFATGDFMTVGGNPAQGQGIPASRLAKWNGAFWQPVGTGLNSTGIAMATFGESMVVGGQFTSVNGQSANGAAIFQRCPIGDINNDGNVNVDDLLAVISAWGPYTPCPPAHAADIAPAGGNCVVNVDDLLRVLAHWD